MRIRRRTWIVPLLALLGILLALFLQPRKRLASPLPAEIPVSSPGAFRPATPGDPGIFQSEDAANSRATKPAAPDEPNDADYHMSVQTEMKVALAGIYSAEKAFYSEYHRYTTDLAALGYFPEPSDKPLRVKAGFLHPFNPAAPLPNERPDQLSTEEMKDKNFKYTAAARAARLDDAARFCHAGCTASESGFEIAVVTTTDGKPDVWLLNQDKYMTHESVMEGAR